MDDLLKALIIVCMPLLTAFIIKALLDKGNITKSNSSLAEYLEYIILAEQLVIDVVVALNQLIVDTAKLEGTFDKQKQKEVFMRATNDLQVLLSEKMKEAIKILYGDFNLWLDTQIESAVKKSKEG